MVLLELIHIEIDLILQIMIRFQVFYFHKLIKILIKRSDFRSIINSLEFSDKR